MFVHFFREAGDHIPHRTVTDFTITFKQSESTESVTHRLFDSVLSKKKLDEMPVFPHTLRVKGNSQPAITCSKLTIETLEQGVKYVQS